MDESSLSTVQDGQCKIVGQKGKKRIGAVTSQERGESVTCVVCMYAVGYFVPPMMIYKCKRNCHGAPPGCVFSCQEKCWMSNAGFVEWLKHFISAVVQQKNHELCSFWMGMLPTVRIWKQLSLPRIMVSEWFHCPHTRPIACSGAASRCIIFWTYGEVLR